jgi:NADP-dependent 3-hydroxy acid dehydrogenase YdfG
MCIFHHNVALVTGGTSGIGKAIAMGLASRGCTTCIVGRNQESLKKVSDEAEFDNIQIKGYVADLEDEYQILQLSRLLQSSFNHIDILIHSAGTYDAGFLREAPVASLDLHYRINVRAPYLLTQLLLPMIVPRCGQIIFINSSAGLNAKPGVGQYAASKHALKAIADSLRGEVNGAGVRIVSVYPGRTATPLMESIYRAEGRTYNPLLLLQPQDVADVVISALSLPRTAEVTDIHVRPMKKA